MLCYQSIGSLDKEEGSAQSKQRRNARSMMCKGIMSGLVIHKTIWLMSGFGLMRGSLKYNTESESTVLESIEEMV